MKLEDGYYWARWKGDCEAIVVVLCTSTYDNAQEVFVTRGEDPYPITDFTIISERLTPP